MLIRILEKIIITLHILHYFIQEVDLLRVSEVAWLSKVLFYMQLLAEKNKFFKPVSMFRKTKLNSNLNLKHKILNSIVLILFCENA